MTKFVKGLEDQRIELNTLELAREKGFKYEVCICGGYPECICDNIPPTQSLLQKWLRNIYKLHITVYFVDVGEYEFSVGSESTSYTGHTLFMAL